MSALGTSSTGLILVSHAVDCAGLADPKSGFQDIFSLLRQMLSPARHRNRLT
jgi:hypothetical protein